MAEGSDISDWFRSIPVITRYWFAASVCLPVLGSFGLLPMRLLFLLYEPIVYNFQFWRPITAVFFYPITPMTGFSYLINLYFLYSYSTRLETGIFDRRPADYLFMLIFCWLLLVIAGFMVPLILLMNPLIMTVLYVWAQLNRDMIVSFFFGTQFKAMYLPWVLMAFNFITRGGWKEELVGILVGHAYFFLAFKYPQDFGGQNYLQTPQILYNYLPTVRGGVSGFGQAPASRRPAQENNDAPRQRHTWGSGQTLGGQ
ncbi:derlin-1-like [Sycon ciliatum]|uniref:derlin-1-like n=1 Tax=Sycon ciliatum TaxID=27933 RepID=UPI0020ABF85F|eukprot:scpid84725/ scgid19596/ Derlin-1; Degradation in endoplasmic reticulum protein 1; Der1-like protein 1